MDVAPTSVDSRRPVSRCVLGRSSAEERAQFTACVTRTHERAARRFSRRWQWEEECEAEGGDGGPPRRWVRVGSWPQAMVGSMSAPFPDLAAFYSRGYSHTRSCRRPLRPCAGKRLLTSGEGEGGADARGSGVRCSPVHYATHSSNVVFLGQHPPPPSPPMRAALSADCLMPLPVIRPSPSLPPAAPSLPPPAHSLPPLPPSLPRPAARDVRRRGQPSSSPPSSSLMPSSSFSASSPQASGWLQAQQTDVWRGRKRWERTPTHSSQADHSKRERLDGL